MLWFRTVPGAAWSTVSRCYGCHSKHSPKMRWARWWQLCTLSSPWLLTVHFCNFHLENLKERFRSSDTVLSQSSPFRGCSILTSFRCSFPLPLLHPSHIMYCCTLPSRGIYGISLLNNSRYSLTATQSSGYVNVVHTGNETYKGKLICTFWP